MDTAQLLHVANTSAFNVVNYKQLIYIATLRNYKQTAHFLHIQNVIKLFLFSLPSTIMIGFGTLSEFVRDDLGAAVLVF